MLRKFPNSSSEGTKENGDNLRRAGFPANIYTGAGVLFKTP
jgi:hypothetical protein